MFLAMDWVAFGSAMVIIIGAVSTATVAIINAIHGARIAQAQQHIENTKALTAIEERVNGTATATQETLNRVIDKLPVIQPEPK